MAALLQRIRARAASLPTFDIPFLLILLLLLSYGLIMLFSAGYAVALYRRGDAYTYIRPQLLFAALGVLAMYAASLVDYHVWHRLAWPMLGISLLLLAIVLFMPEYNGCKRWIVLPGLGTLQPSEIAKFSIVLVFSHIISLNHDRMKSFSTGVVPFALILGVVTVLMLLEPHLSGTLLILSIGAVLMFVGGTGLHWFGLAGGLGAAAIAAAVIALPELVPYATDRLASWRDPFADPLGEGHQTIQSLYAIASGGLAGLGLGNSRQKYLYVPEPQNDFIFSILCEELGFIGAALVVALFLLLLLRGMSIAVRARDKFGALLVVGFVVQVTLQAILNMAVVTNTIPNTGISLPFFSSGGTSLLMLLGEMGIVLFTVLLTYGAILAGADSFWTGAEFAAILFLIVGAWDMFFLDWVLFAHLKVFRLPGTEHMDKAYAQKWFHVKGMLFPGSLFLVIISMLTGLLVMWVK